METKQSWYWIGQAIEPGGHLWISDEPDPPAPIGMTAYPLVLPEWFPRRTYLCYAWIGAGGNRLLEASEITEITFWVDPYGQAYHGGDPPGSENGDVSHDITIFHAFTHEQYISDDRAIVPPVVFDRDAGDKLLFMLASNIPFSWVYFDLQFLIIR